MGSEERFDFSRLPYQVLQVLTRPQTASSGQQLILLQADNSVVLIGVSAAKTRTELTFFQNKNVEVEEKTTSKYINLLKNQR